MIWFLVGVGLGWFLARQATPPCVCRDTRPADSCGQVECAGCRTRINPKSSDGNIRLKCRNCEVLDEMFTEL